MIGPHAMSLHRTTLALRGVLRALDLAQARAGQRLRVAGMVTARQRPGASKGFVFLTLEDETGISNVLIRPAGFRPPSASLLVGNPRSPSGPPTLSHFART